MTIRVTRRRDSPQERAFQKQERLTLEQLMQNENREYETARRIGVVADPEEPDNPFALLPDDTP